jgi:hypothetical protein
MIDASFHDPGEGIAQVDGRPDAAKFRLLGHEGPGSTSPDTDFNNVSIEFCALLNESP